MKLTQFETACRESKLHPDSVLGFRDLGDGVQIEVRDGRGALTFKPGARWPEAAESEAPPPSTFRTACAALGIEPEAVHTYRVLDDRVRLLCRDGKVFYANIRAIAAWKPGETFEAFALRHEPPPGR